MQRSVYDNPELKALDFEMATRTFLRRGGAGRGGEVCHGPFDTPFGRIVVCTDPQGAVFSVVQSAG